MFKKIRAKRMIEIYEPYLKNNKILDIGCGDGKLVEEFDKFLDNKLLKNVQGINKIKYNPKFKFELMEKENLLPFRDKEFNMSMLNDVLHHVSFENQIKLIDEALRVSRNLLINEIENSFVAKLMDWVTNLKYSETKLPFSMRNFDDWQELFIENNYEFESYIVKKTLICPIRTFIFVLK